MKVKFIHTADVHLGVRPDAGKAYTKNRPEEIWRSFERLISLCEREKTDLLLIAGDLFHRQPLLREMKEVNALFARLTHTKVVLVAGNHDFVKQDSYYRSFRWARNVFPLLGKEMQKIEFPELRTAVSGFSYWDREYREGIRDSWKCRRTQDTEILILHGGDEKHLPFRKRETELLGYDYVALGHIHKPDQKEQKSSYCGALEPTDPNDTGDHGFILGAAANGLVKTRFVPFASRKYIHLDIQADEKMTGSLLRDTIREKIEEQGIENMYRVEITGFRDPDIEFAAASMDPYGNVIDVLDFTNPSYDFGKLSAVNKGNLLGRFIQSFEKEGEDGLLEEMALYEGVKALLETKRGS